MPHQTVSPRIICETDSFIAVEKPHNMTTAPLHDDCEPDTLLTWIIKHCPQCGKVACNTAIFPGRKMCEHGLLHRLDAGTRGIVIAAKTDSFFTYLLQEQRAGRITKTYRAMTTYQPDTVSPGNGYPPLHEKLQPGFIINSTFRPYGIGRKAVRPVTEQSGRAAQKKVSATVYETYCGSIQRKSGEANTYEIICTIKNGFRHQIRCHLAWYGYPIIGDVLYGGSDGSVLELHAERIEFADYDGVPVIITL